MIVVVFLFGFLFSVSRTLQDDRLNEQAAQLVDQTFQSDTLNNYVKYCVERVTSNGIVLMGLQGGYLYDYQKVDFSKSNESLQLNRKNMALNSNYAFANNSINISYGILAPKYDDGSSTFKPVPYYPYEGYIFDSDGDLVRPYWYYGNSNLPALCEIGGPNNITISTNGVLRLNFNKTPITCYSYGYNSSQKQLSEYVKNNIEECLNFNDVMLILSINNISINSSKINSSILIASRSLVVNITLPLDVNFGTGKLYTQFKGFNSEVKIKLNEIYEFADSVILRDKNELIFDTSTDFLQLQSYDNHFNIDRFCPYCRDVYPFKDFTDVYRITDESNQIDGGDFIFQFAIENRVPILEYIHELHLSEFAEYDIIVKEGAVINISPEGYDLDEDHLDYWYTGWKQTYDSYFNFSCCSNFGGDVDCQNNPWSCVLLSVDPPINRWTDSQPYLDTFRASEYETNRSDVGAHNVTVYVKDDEGLLDYQVVHILVNDIPIPVVNNSNLFDDILDGYASLEDIYILDGTLSATVMGGLIFEWVDIIENLYREGPMVYLPSENYLIENITDDGVPFDVLGEHMLRMTIDDTLGGVTYKDFQVNVYECLPHKSNIPSFPYNSFEWAVTYSKSINNSYGFDVNGDILSILTNPYTNYNSNGTPDDYFGDHICCYDFNEPSIIPKFEWGEIVDIANGHDLITCYNYSEFGSFNSIDFLRFNKTRAAPTDIPGADYKNYRRMPGDGIGVLEALKNYILTGYNPSVVQYYLDSNDIFTRSFERYCSGERGNVCDGDAFQVVEIIEECNDTINAAVFQHERCSGPAPQYMVENESAANVISCVDYSVFGGSGDYPGTFEYFMAEKTPDDLLFDFADSKLNDGLCTNNWVLSNCTGPNCLVGSYVPTRDNYHNRNDISTDYICQGGCDGQGGCTYGYNCQDCNDYDGVFALNFVKASSNDADANWPATTPGVLTAGSSLKDFFSKIDGTGNYYCESSSRDADDFDDSVSNPNHLCSLYSGASIRQFGFTNAGTTSIGDEGCCGDDLDEFTIGAFCCDDATDCVDSTSGVCVDSTDHDSALNICNAGSWINWGMCKSVSIAGVPYYSRYTYGTGVKYWSDITNANEKCGEQSHIYYTLSSKPAPTVVNPLATTPCCNIHNVDSSKRCAGNSCQDTFVLPALALNACPHTAC